MTNSEKINVFIAVNDPWKEPNPYIRTLIEGINSYGSIKWGYGIDKFWDDDIFNFDIIHIHWPNLLLSQRGEHSICDLKERITLLKQKGIRIVATCHNISPHYVPTSSPLALSYSIVYSLCDVMIHLGEGSLNQLSSILMQNTY